MQQPHPSHALERKQQPFAPRELTSATGIPSSAVYSKRSGGHPTHAGLCASPVRHGLCLTIQSNVKYCVLMFAVVSLLTVVPIGSNPTSPGSHPSITCDLRSRPCAAACSTDRLSESGEMMTTVAPAGGGMNRLGEQDKTSAGGINVKLHRCRTSARK